MKGQPPLQKDPGCCYYLNFSHPPKDKSAIILNEPQIIVMK